MAYNPCQCAGQPLPEEWKLTFAGTISNDACTDCSDFLGNIWFLKLDTGSCDTWSTDVSMGPCGTDPAILTATANADGTWDLLLTISFSLDPSSPDGNAQWEKKGIRQLAADQELPFLSQTSSQCDFSGSTVRLTPVGLSLNTAPDSADCISPVTDGTPPGTCLVPPLPPETGEGGTGWPPVCTGGEGCGCGCGRHAGGYRG